MKFFLIPLLFGSWFLNAVAAPLSDSTSKSSAVQWYNQGIKYYNSQKKIKATASFRKALQIDPWLWPAKKALDQLQYSPPFWTLIPSEIFLAMIAVSLTFLFFSTSISKLVLFGFSLIMHFSFSYYRNIPRITILEETTAHTAPNDSSPVLFPLHKGEWVMQLKTSKEWIQIKTAEQSVGWISKIKLHPINKSYNYEKQKIPEQK